MSAQSVIKGRFDNYAIGPMIAKGGMGTVNLATNSKGSKVIIKIPLVTGDPQDTLRVEKLKVEATILKDIAIDARQNSIVKYLDESIQNNTFHLITEKVDGKTLDEEVGHTPMGEKTALQHISQILRALKYIHAKNVIHRDIKPKNIINLANKVRKQGGKVETHFYPGIDHAGILAALSIPLQSTTPILEDIFHFVQQQEKPSEK